MPPFGRHREFNRGLDRRKRTANVVFGGDQKRRLDRWAVVIGATCANSHAANTEF